MEGRWKPEDQESQIGERSNAELEKEEEKCFDSEEEIAKTEEENIEAFFSKSNRKWKFGVSPTSDDEYKESQRRKRIRGIKEWTDDDTDDVIDLLDDEENEKDKKKKIMMQ